MSKLPIKQIVTSLVIVGLITVAIYFGIKYTWEFMGIDPDSGDAVLPALGVFLVLGLAGLFLWKKVKE
jgi:LPXTG-motif cell wall-anchored protein